MSLPFKQNYPYIPPKNLEGRLAALEQQLHGDRQEVSNEITSRVSSLEQTAQQDRDNFKLATELIEKLGRKIAALEDLVHQRDRPLERSAWCLNDYLQNLQLQQYTSHLAEYGVVDVSDFHFFDEADWQKLEDFMTGFHIRKLRHSVNTDMPGSFEPH
mmetsp:Transcript_32052/g.46902  ORF Transcript_32052/g.46902 Transcript_32052/m.46902 type:complete len:158 (+) Transcript_32052:19-492(+)